MWKLSARQWPGWNYSSDLQKSVWGVTRELGSMLNYTEGRNCCDRWLRILGILLSQAKGYIWPYIPPLVLIRIQYIPPLVTIQVEYEVDQVIIFSQKRKMLLNPLKTKTMMFNTMLKYDVFSQISTERGKYMDVVEEHKILRFILRSDLKTIFNTEYIFKKAYPRMWLIRRLKTLGYPIPELLEILQKQRVSLCEFGATYWGCMITKNKSNILERCLKHGLHIIYQEQYISFTHCLKLANISSLK